MCLLALFGNLYYTNASCFSFNQDNSNLFAYGCDVFLSPANLHKSVADVEMVTCSAHKLI